VWRRALAGLEKLVAEPPDAKGPQQRQNERAQLAKYQLDYANFLNTLGRPRDAEEAYRKAITNFQTGGDPPPGFIRSACHINLGNLLQHANRLKEAEQEYRDALADLEKEAPVNEPADVLNKALAHNNLGDVLLRQGRFREALGELRRGHELGARNSNWPYPSAVWVEECRRLLEFDALRPAVLRGEADPADAGAALGFARVCQLTKRPAAAARLSARAFDDSPEAANDLRTGLRYNAACSAALAGCGQGDDAPADEAGRADLRAQALTWLRADLNGRTTQTASWFAAVRQEAVQALRHWQEDADFAGVRGEAALAKLPEAERDAWRNLWSDVEKALAKAQGDAAPEGKVKDKP
jgi:tetratricopeptide (TPR) repeat protein